MAYPTPVSLYERLGGEAGVAALTDRLYDKILGDPELAPLFANSSVEQVRTMQRRFIATALGADLPYTGRDLRSVHQGRGITTRHFYLFCRKLFDALAAMGISSDDAFEVVDRLAVNANHITCDVTSTD